MTAGDPAATLAPGRGLNSPPADGIEWAHLLPVASRRKLCELARTLTADASSTLDEFVGQAKQASGRLPVEVRRALRWFKRYGSGTGVFLLCGLRTGHVPATPPDNWYHVGERTLLAKQQAILAAQLGEMIACWSWRGNRCGSPK
ncbi:MAG: hypothetical protein ACRDT0_17640 [Pseudonocardiaceae bacterium]